MHVNNLLASLLLHLLITHPSYTKRMSLAVSVVMERLDLLVVEQRMKEGLKSALTMLGEQCVMTVGILIM